MDRITESMEMNLVKLQEIVKDREDACCSSWGRGVGGDLVTEQQQSLTIQREKFFILKVEK